MSDMRTTGNTEIVPSRRSPRSRDSRPRSSRQGLIALSVLVAIVVAAAMILSLAPRDSSPGAVAERYMEARAALDSEAAIAEMSPEVVITDVPRMEDFDDIADQFAFLAALNHELTEYECLTPPEAIETEPVRVICTYEFTTNLSQALDVEPIDGSIVLSVENGQIVRLLHMFNFEQFSPRVFEVFIGWLNENHPGVAERTWTDDRGVTTFIVSEENLAELERHIAEFEAAHAG